MAVNLRLLDDKKGTYGTLNDEVPEEYLEVRVMMGAHRRVVSLRSSCGSISAH